MPFLTSTPMLIWRDTNPGSDRTPDTPSHTIAVLVIAIGALMTLRGWPDLVSLLH